MLREFTDPNGNQWRVWDVNPVLHMRGASAALRESLKVPSDWLCFESEDEHRRLTPIPEAWTDCDSEELLKLLDSAERVIEREREGR